MSPCDLFTEADERELEVTENEGERQVGTGRACRLVTKAGNTGALIRTNTGLDGVPAGEGLRSITVGSHEAKIWGNTATSACTVFLGVSESSRVDVSAVDRQGNVEESCALAERTAELVEKNLPES
ncbi:hypothetical protein Actkin_03978 [Actinokineospora sp. UTMC 2448]|nr:hypothetical protein Actkin_03978 [Actinokineospora sp. UTMC 2448]